MTIHFWNEDAELTVRWSRDEGEVIISLSADWEEGERVLLDGSFNAEKLIESIKEESGLDGTPATADVVGRAHDVLTALGAALSREDVRSALEYAFSSRTRNAFEIEEALYASGDYIVGLDADSISSLADHLDRTGYKLC